MAGNLKGNFGINAGGVFPTTSELISLTGSALETLSTTVPANSTNQNYNVSFPATSGAIQGFYLNCGAAATVNINSTTGTAFTLTANTPVTWYPGCGYALPFGGASQVSNIYVTSVLGGDIELRALYNA